MPITKIPLSDQDVAPFGEFAPFITRNGLLDLGEGQPATNEYDKLSALNAALLSQDSYAQCCLSAVWLFQDYLEESHSVSQGVHTAEGSYLHGIMHRREGDFSNAKYWFRKAGDLEFFGSVANQIQADSLILPTVKEEMEEFDPIVLTELVANLRGSTKSSLERITYWELLAIFEYCFVNIPK